jgi:hypothetical protein
MVVKFKMALVHHRAQWGNTKSYNKTEVSRLVMSTQLMPKSMGGCKCSHIGGKRQIPNVLKINKVLASQY